MGSEYQPGEVDSGAIPLSSQVGGHAGVLSSQDGSLIIKPCLHEELEFYTTLAAAQAAIIAGEDLPFQALAPWAPKFYGTLKLEGEIDRQGTATEDGVSVMKPVEGSLVLENVSHPFFKPNILDIKLGTVLYESDASPEKIERMTRTAKATTSFETGVRLTGFQVYDGTTGQAVVTPKSYGKLIKSSQLPDGIARFFPILEPINFNADSSSTGGEKSSPRSGGVSGRLLLPVLEGVLELVRELGVAAQKTEMRMVGGSVLIVWEGDEETLEAALAAAPIPHVESESESEDELAEGEGDGAKKVGPPFTVRLIDFAHTKFAPGQGPDEGVLKGLQTVTKLIEGRIEEVRSKL
ncbi:uncharacterized protein EI90DRAFT_2900891 [Cantharellus anzutake]|uniref:uncharacterized protein n=1 Tax=Cantharellus anzutake TaxID=1750568 RepID=UPI001904F376|nr:uncharacterized protein EI90DRAFT_2900891 [Cantharellus anzutake]KAF8344128.1 hypothetical protein EI90DRAFT_2900891 [Cantharellus anzutake]